MTSPGDERRQAPERRLFFERRDEGDRREGLEVGHPLERRFGEERRQGGERRTGIERRLSVQSASDQIHGALRLLTRVVESGLLTENELRALEAAMLRLRFALDRLEES